MDLRQPILRRGYPSQIFFDMLFGDVANGNSASVAVDDGNSTDLFAEEDAFMGLGVSG